MCAWKKQNTVYILTPCNRYTTMYLTGTLWSHCPLILEKSAEGHQEGFVT